MTHPQPKPYSHRKQYFDVVVHHPKVKDCISGRNEDDVMRVFDSLGYELGKDYVRQHPVGDRFVLDFAFVKEQVCVEVDGKDHYSKEAVKIDKKRDRFLYYNNWVVIRVREDKFFGYGASFYKYLIDEVVKERREQWESGRLYPIDILEYKEQDYE